MDKKLRIIFLALIICSLNACDNNRIKSQSTTQQLNQYIGQTPAEIKQNLTLQNFKLQQPVLNGNQLIYTVERRVTTPIPTGAAAILDHNGRMIPTQLSTTSDPIQNTLKCNIIFDIEKGIAKSYQLKGRGC